METMAFIRFLTDGELGHDLANPFKTAFIQCTKCDGTMLLDRETWRADCMKCSHSEHDVPEMIVSRSDLDRAQACIAFELSKTTQVFPLSEDPSFEKLEALAGSVKCTMGFVKEAHVALLNSELLKEALLIRDKIIEVDVSRRMIGAVIKDGQGLFLFPEIKMSSMVEYIDIVSMRDPEITWRKRRGCDVLQRRIY